MQAMPAYCYLLPTVLLFDIGSPAAVIATVIFALAPAVRLTVHGIRRCPDRLVEVGTAHGATGGQVPGRSSAARPAGPPPRRQPDHQARVRRRRHRRARRLAGARAGRARTGCRRSTSVWPSTPAWPSCSSPSSSTASRAAAPRRSVAPMPRRDPAVKRRDLLIGLGILTVVVVISRLAHADQFPDGWTFSLRDPVNDVGRMAAGPRAHRRAGHRRHVGHQRLPGAAHARAAAAAPRRHAVVDRHGRDRSDRLGAPPAGGWPSSPSAAWWPSAGSASGTTAWTR